MNFKLFTNRASFLWETKSYVGHRCPRNCCAACQQLPSAATVLLVWNMLFFCSRRLCNCLSLCTTNRPCIFKMVTFSRHLISQQLEWMRRRRPNLPMQWGSLQLPAIFWKRSLKTAWAVCTWPTQQDGNPSSTGISGEKTSLLFSHFRAFLTLTAFVTNETVKSINTKHRCWWLVSHAPNNHEIGFKIGQSIPAASFLPTRILEEQDMVIVLMFCCFSWIKLEKITKRKKSHSLLQLPA